MPRDAVLPTPATPFIGRRRALRNLTEVLERGERLVTIVGAGGIGKTRLAIELGRRRGERGDAIRFVDLTEQHDADGLATALARALEARGTNEEDLVAALRRLRRGVLILDNFEQIAPHAGALSRWLSRCPDLTVIVTSREVLRLEGEVVWELDPLEIEDPDDKERMSEALMLWSSVRQRIDPSYSTATDDREALLEILSRLDGIPLAIELAAARANLMSTGQLRDRLGRRFDVLKDRSRDRTARRRTMEGALDWSFQLLEPWERDALSQCSVFRGGFSLDAAESVIDLAAFEGAPGVLDVLQALRDKSLLRRVVDAPGRLAMFATVRDYGAERLKADAAAQLAAEQRHARYFGHLGRALVEMTLTAEGADALFELGREVDNCVAVVERATSRSERTTSELDDALDAALAVDAVFAARGPTGGQRDLLNALIAASDAVELDPRRLSRALRARGLLTAASGALARARADLERAAELADSGGERGRALLDLSWTYLRERDLDRLNALCEEALTLARDAGDRQLEGMVLGAMGAVPKERGDDAAAEALYREALLIHREVGNAWYEGQAHTRLAVLYLEHGDIDRTREHAQSALTVHREFGIRVAEALMLQILGGAAQLEGHLEEARDAYAEGAQICEEIGEGRLLSTGLGYRAIAELELGDLEAAREHFEEACGVSQRVGEHRHGALFRAYVGAVEALRGDPDHAESHLARARASLRAHPDARIEASVDVLSVLTLITRAARGEAEARAAIAPALAQAVAPRGGLSAPEASSADTRIALRIVRHALAALEQAGSTQESLRIDPGGAWFEPPGGHRVDCRRRQALRRILVRLARHRVQQPGAAIAPDSLIAAGWPDERMSQASAQNRLYVTINRLRQLGLGDVLQLIDGGYRLDPETPLALIPD
ncbi:MAG: AAA family ATPase [Sandaracinaceae bacterium]